MKYDKLVRDNIPSIIQAGGKSCRTKLAEGKDLTRYLKKKIKEEIDELFDDPCDEEMGDVLEVLETIATHLGVDMYSSRFSQLKKGIDKGVFSKGIILEEVYDD